MEKWMKLVTESITKPEELARKLEVNEDDLARVSAVFPFRINAYYLSLIKEKNDPIWKQAIPDIQELSNAGFLDPLAEENHSPVKSITHRYPDRVLFYVSHICPMYCRFCTRKRKVGNPQSINSQEIERGLTYIQEHAEIRDVIVSGGDPLMAADAKIEYILKRLRKIKHIEIIRIGTRTPVTLPQRITENLCNILKRYHPLYFNVHFNHPHEITPESHHACDLLANAGIPLGNQSVLLRGVNDDPGVMKQLVCKLLSIRVKPYYIYMADLVNGNNHFRTAVQTGLDIINALRGHISGMAVPHFVIDTPGGGGKVALIPNPVTYADEKEIIIKNYEGELYSYPAQACQLEYLNTKHG